MMINTCQSEYGKLVSVLLKHPEWAYVSETSIDNQWVGLNYTSRPDLQKAIGEYERFLDIFREHEIQTHFLPQSNETGLDSIYVRDASIITNQGAIICNMGKGLRKGEPARQLDMYNSIDISIHGKIEGIATIEGGDVAWIDENTLAVARGYRTNEEGIIQLKNIIDESIELVVVHSPHYKGPSDVFHLMSVFSPVDERLAVVYSPLMSVPFREFLIHRGYAFIEVPDEEFGSLGCNVLALAPGLCMMVKGNPVTKGRLNAEGIEVVEFSGDEICMKGNGGPTCLTRPLVRSK